MTMNDLNALLRAVITIPDDDTVRLVYADALDELPTVTVKCARCKGKGCYSFRSAEFGYEVEDCEECGKSGTVTDHTNHNRAEFVRVQIKVNELHTCDCAPSLFVVPDCPVCAVVKPHRYRANALLTPICDVYRPQVTYSWGVVIAERTGTSDGPMSWVWRGFVNEITCTAEQFLAHADELIWHEAQTVECERCAGDGKAHGSDRPFEWSADVDYGKCVVCKGSGIVPRPCPDTAQPIRKVVLTTGHEDLDVTGWHSENGKWYHVRWPGVEFELPISIQVTEDFNISLAVANSAHGIPSVFE